MRISNGRMNSSRSSNSKLKIIRVEVEVPGARLANPKAKRKAK
jgi:hypothetical protein